MLEPVRAQETAEAQAASPAVVPAVSLAAVPAASPAAVLAVVLAVSLAAVLTAEQVAVRAIVNNRFFLIDRFREGSRWRLISFCVLWIFPGWNAGGLTAGNACKLVITTRLICGIL